MAKKQDKRKKFSDETWEAIEREYCLGQKSYRLLSKEFGPSAAAICKRAKREGWVQDKSAEVLIKTKAALLVDPKSGKVNREVNAPTKEDVDRAVKTNVELIRSHRRDIGMLRKIEAQLLKKLHDNPTKLYITQYQGKIVEKEIYLDVQARAATASYLAQVQHKRIALERQAFNIDIGGGIERITGIKIEFDGTGNDSNS